MSDIYKAPEAKLTHGGESGSYGSLEKGLAGDYIVSIGEIISEAWQKTKGNKVKFWLAILLYAITLSVVNLIIGNSAVYFVFSLGLAESGVFILFGLVLLLFFCINESLKAGILMLGIKIARDERVLPTEVFSHFNKLLPIAIVNGLVWTLIYAGYFLLIIPGIYLKVAYMLAVPLVVDKNMGPWQAMETSRKAITKHWFSFFGLLLIGILLFILGALPLLIGLIWVLPLLSIAFGIVYRNVFGGAED